MPEFVIKQEKWKRKQTHNRWFYKDTACIQGLYRLWGVRMEIILIVKINISLLLFLKIIIVSFSVGAKNRKFLFCRDVFERTSKADITKLKFVPSLFNVIKIGEVFLLSCLVF